MCFNKFREAGVNEVCFDVGGWGNPIRSPSCPLQCQMVTETATPHPFAGRKTSWHMLQLTWQVDVPWMACIPCGEGFKCQFSGLCLRCKVICHYSTTHKVPVPTDTPTPHGLPLGTAVFGTLIICHLPVCVLINLHRLNELSRPLELRTQSERGCLLALDMVPSWPSHCVAFRIFTGPFAAVIVVAAIRSDGQHLGHRA